MRLKAIYHAYNSHLDGNLVATRKDPIDLVDLPAKIRDYYNEGKADKFLVTKIKGTNKWMLKSWRSKKVG